MPALVQIMAWCRKGHKPLSEAMLIYCTDTYASLGLNEESQTSVVCVLLLVSCILNWKTALVEQGLLWSVWQLLASVGHNKTSLITLHYQPVLQSGIWHGPKKNILQWNLYKITTEFCGLWRLVVFHTHKNWSLKVKKQNKTKKGEFSE